jgi:hypothetical protein
MTQPNGPAPRRDSASSMPAQPRTGSSPRQDVRPTRLITSPQRAPAVLLALLGAVLLLPGAAAAQVVRGSVIEEESESPIANVEVLVRDTAGGSIASTRSDAEGHFLIELEVVGTFNIVFRHLAYAEVTSRNIAVRPGEDVLLQVRLSVEAMELDPVTVIARRYPNDPRLRDFYDRAGNFAATGRGRIIMRDDLDAIRPVHTSNIINTLPPRYRCSTVFVDGLIVDDARFLDSVIRPDEIEGIEAYNDRVHIPLQYQGSSTECAILIWRRPYAEGGRPFNLLRFAGVAAGFAALVLLLR